METSLFESESEPIIPINHLLYPPHFRMHFRIVFCLFHLFSLLLLLLVVTISSYCIFFVVAVKWSEVFTVYIHIFSLN